MAGGGGGRVEDHATVPADGQPAQGPSAGGGGADLEVEDAFAASSEGIAHLGTAMEDGSEAGGDHSGS